MEGAVWEAADAGGVARVGAGGRQRPGMPVAVQEQVRERQRTRLGPPPALPAEAKRGAAAGWGERPAEKEREATVGGGGNVRPFEMKPTRPDSAMGSGGGRAGAPPVFFPPSAPIPRAPYRARPTIDDLVRREVLELPDNLSAGAIATDALEQSAQVRRVVGCGAGCDESMDVSRGSIGASRGQARQAAEGHDDLLA